MNRSIKIVYTNRFFGLCYKYHALQQIIGGLIPEHTRHSSKNSRFSSPPPLFPVAGSDKQEKDCSNDRYDWKGETENSSCNDANEWIYVRNQNRLDHHEAEKSSYKHADNSFDHIFLQNLLHPSYHPQVSNPEMSFRLPDEMGRNA